MSVAMVPVIVPVPISMVAVVLVLAVVIAVICVIFVLAIVVAVILTIFCMVLVAVPVLFPAVMTSPVGVLAACREWTMIAVPRIKIAIDVPTKSDWPVKPWPRADEYSAHKPLRSVVSKWRALVWCVVEVPVGTYRRRSDLDVDADLGY